MAGAHLGLQQQRHVVGAQGAELGTPLRRLVVAHAGVVETARDVDGGVVGADGVVVRRVAEHVTRRRLAARVAPLLPLGDGEGQRGIAHRADDVDERHFGHDRGEQIGAHGHAGPHEEATGTTAADGDAPGRSPARCHEVLHRRDRVGEGVPLREQLAVGVPPSAELAAASRMHERPHPPTVEQRDAADPEPRCHRRFVAAVAVHHARGGAVGGGVAPAHDVDGHSHAVGCGGPLACGHVLREVDVRGGSLLQQRALAGDEVVLVERGRCGERLVRVPQRVRSPFGVCVELEFVGLIAEVDHLDGAVASEHTQALLGLRPLVHHQVGGERLDGRDPLPLHVRHQLGPFAGRIERCGHHPEVLGVEVGEHHEAVAPVIDAVLDVVHAIAHRPQRRRWIPGGQDPCLRTLLARRIDHDPFGAA